MCLLCFYLEKCRLDKLLIIPLFLFLLFLCLCLAEFKFDGFSAETCRSLVAMKDVSFRQME